MKKPDIPRKKTRRKAGPERLTPDTKAKEKGSPAGRQDPIADLPAAPSAAAASLPQLNVLQLITAGQAAASAGVDVQRSVDAENLLWKLLKRKRCDIHQISIEELVRVLREDILISMAPSIVNRIWTLRYLLEQARHEAGTYEEVPPLRRENPRLYDLGTIVDELARLADAIAFGYRPTKRSGRPPTPHALTKRFDVDDVLKLKAALAELLWKVYKRALAEKVLSHDEVPLLATILQWTRRADVAEASKEAQDLASKIVPGMPLSFWTLQLARRLREMVTGRHARQHVPLLTAHWANELLLGMIGLPLMVDGEVNTEIRGHRSKRSR